MVCFCGRSVLRSFGNEQLLWIARIVLLVSVVLHMVAAYQLVQINHQSRPVRYARPGVVQASYASRTMRWGGIIIFLFIIYHLLHFTTGTVHPNFVPGDVYHNLVTGFQVWYVSLFYILAMVALGFHMYHGVWSMFQTLGLNSSRYTRGLRWFATIAAAVVAIGNISISCRGATRHRQISSDSTLSAVDTPLAPPAVDVVRRPLEINDPLLDSKIPSGPIEKKWEKHRFDLKLVNPANKRKFEIIVVGTGLAGASAAASLAELGYNVKCFCYQDSPRRAHSIAAQGGINAAKNYQNDGDSVYRLFYDTIKGGDFRSREANVYRLAQISVNIIDQCVAQGVPFAREYGGLLANRSFGGAQVSRTFYARGQTGQQLLLGAYQALERQIGLGKVKMYPRTEMLDLVVDRRPRQRHRHARYGHRRDRVARRRCRGAGDRRLRQRLLPFDQRQRLQRHRDLARLQDAARSSPTLASRRSIRPASRSAASISRS